MSGALCSTELSLYKCRHYLHIHLSNKMLKTKVILQHTNNKIFIIKSLQVAVLKINRSRSLLYFPNHQPVTLELSKFGSHIYCNCSIRLDEIPKISGRDNRSSNMQVGQFSMRKQILGNVMTSGFPKNPPGTAHAALNQLLKGKHMHVAEDVRLNSPENSTYKSYAR
jgi:hypothetical protein